jgi:NADPH-dependent 2,4-dienoyl-CoA reductase/sulfur reductase-like enzyme
VTATHGLVIVGGSDAGIMAGLWARETDPGLPVTLVVRDAYPNFSICGIPFYLSGETPDWLMLAHRTRDDIEAMGVRLLLDHEATAIDPERRAVAVRSATGTSLQLPYDELVVGTGAVPIRPRLPGVALPGVHMLHTIHEARHLHGRVVRPAARRAVLIGAGYVGTEMADALTHRGLEVTIVEMAPAVLTTFDTDLGELVGSELRRHGVNVECGKAVERIEQKDGLLHVVGSHGLDAAGDIVLVAVGIRPHTELAQQSGIAVNQRGAVVVDDRMRTNLDHVWAAGDCVHTHHVLLKEPTYLPLGTTAHKQGRVAGINAAGGDARFAGSCGTQSVKIFELVAARTGLRDHEARAAGFEPASVTVEVDDHKAYYPGATKIHVRITGDRQTGRLLGAQLLGAYGAEVSKRVDIVAAAIHAGASVEGLNEFDLSYTPPLSSPWDPIQTAAQSWLRTVR